MSGKGVGCAYCGYTAFADDYPYHVAPLGDGRGPVLHEFTPPLPAAPAEPPALVPLFQRLRLLRAKARLTLAQASTRAGLSLSYLSDIERGRTLPALQPLERLAGVYGLTLAECLHGVTTSPTTLDGSASASDSRPGTPD